MRAKPWSPYATVSVLTLLAVVAGLVVWPKTAYEVKTLTILYTGDTYGQLESCG